MTRDEIMERVTPTARMLFEKDGHLDSVFIAFKSDDSIMIIAAPWRDEDEKAIMLTMIKQTFAEQRVTAYALVSEIWMKRFDVGNRPPPGVMVSNYEDRDEGVHILVVDRDGVDSRIYQIKRPMDGSPATLSAEHSVSGDSFVGRMTELLS